MGTIVKKIVVFLLLAVSIALILWITLFSRIGADTREILPPFWSYREFLNGNRAALIENIENIILFIPIGMAAALIFNLNFWQALLAGFVFSLIIECCQWNLWLGSFEVDDLIHNTLGALIGAVLINGTKAGRALKLPKKDWIINLVVLVVMIALLVPLGFSYRKMVGERMEKYAAMNDRSDGLKNLLVLDANPKKIEESNFKISYKPDGSMQIKGSTKELAWIEIGRLTLPQGSYCFGGLSDVPAETVALELEYFNKEQGDFVRLTEDVGPIEKTSFELTEETEVRALVRLYPGSEGKYLARPVIYREE